MTRKGKLTFVSMMIFCASVSAQQWSDQKVVYGDDDRIEAREYKRPKGSGLKKSQLRAIAAMVPVGKIKKKNFLQYVLESKPLNESRRLCEGEKFFQQPVVANCTGFLVGPRMLVTAGHCVQNEEDCKKADWVFSFRDKKFGKATTVPKWKRYACKKVLKTVLDVNTQDDYAIIELDRRVVGVKPLKVRQKGQVKKGEKLVVVGHPSGLPLKVAGGAAVRDNDNPVFFRSNLDTFGGNSGSPVFNFVTGMVEGILVRGERDYAYDFSGQCYRVNYCSDEGCRGEDVTRITNLELSTLQ